MTEDKAPEVALAKIASPARMVLGGCSVGEGQYVAEPGWRELCSRCMIWQQVRKG